MQVYSPARWRILFSISLLAFTAFLDFTIVNTALPFIQQDLGTSVIQLQWITNIFAMMISMFMVIVGRMGDLLGRRNVFFSGTIIFTLGTIGAALSPSINILIFFRAIQGMGASILYTLSGSMIPELFPAEERIKSIGFYAGFTGLGLAIGPFLGGVLTHSLGWRWVFWVNIPILAVGLLICLFYFRQIPNMRRQVQLDLLGTLFLILIIGLLIFGIVHAGQTSWTNDIAWACIAAGFIFLGLLIFAEVKEKEPILDFNIFKNPLIQIAMLNCMVTGLMNFVLMFFDTIYLNVVRDLSALEIGYIMVAAPAIQAILAFFFNSIEKQFGIKKIIIFSLFSGLLAAICQILIGIDSPYFLIILALIFVGINWGIANAGAIIIATQTVPEEKLGVTLGTIFTLWNMSGAIFLAICSVILHNTQRLNLVLELAKLPDITYKKTKELIKLAFTDPSDIKTKIIDIIGVEYTDTVLEIFKSSFFQGFHIVMWFVGLLCLIALVLSRPYRFSNMATNVATPELKNPL